MFELPSAPPAAWEQAIGGYIAELIEDGATLQLGIGGIPNAITAFLMERRDLGIHTEMFTDGMVDLYQAGVVTGRRKTLWNGKMVGAFALGSQKLYDFIDKNLGVEFQQGKVTNDPYTIARNNKMVSVNTALQVDINGQVCSQSIGSRHYSGTGGQLDTHRGAQMSPGGRGIIALRSTAKGGKISTIVPVLSEGSEVTVPGQDVDSVVTEYGIARLRGLSIKKRMEALIKIAHPGFRDWIREEAERLKIVPRLVVPGFEAEEGRAQPQIEVSAPAPIKLGTLTDLSGPQASIGMAALRGVSTYYEHVNHWGGINGRKIELVVEDHAFDPDRAKAAVVRLVEVEEVFAIVSPLGTGPNLAILDYVLDEGIPVVSPHSGISIWSEPLKRTYFALQPSYPVEGRILAQYVTEELKPERISVFAVDDHFGQEGAGAFLSEMKEVGVRAPTILFHPVGENAPEKWVVDLSAPKPDLVLLYTYVKPAADLLRAAFMVGFRPTWLGNYVISGPDLFQFAGVEAAHGLRATSYPSGPRAHRGERLYHKLMKRNYPDEVPGTHSRIGYAAAQLVVEGLHRADLNLSRQSFIQALESLENWTGGLLPPISYSSGDHRGLTALALQRAINGRWVVEKGLLRLKE
jgi:ABC-type branched-subunit amino acid transport system substrate-binding protein/acyl CoA:acetate/3-ketoacid CoA transferase beta subunit